MAKNINILPNSRVIKKIHVRDSIKKKGGKLPKIISIFRFIFKNFGNIFTNFLSQKAIDLFLTPFDKPRHLDPKDTFKTALEKNITVNDLSIKTYTWGNGSKTVLLVHGWESRSCYMSSFVPHLLENGFKVIAFDGPAHGLSDGKMTNMVDFGKVTNFILSQDSSIQKIIVHSFGGPSTVYTLANSVYKNQIDQMVIIASPNNISDVLSRFCTFFHIPTKMEKRMVGIIEKLLNHPIEQSYMNYNIPKIGLKSILLVYDELDDIVPFQDGLDVFEANPNTSLILSKGLGHSKMKYYPEIIESIVDFLK